MRVQREATYVRVEAPAKLNLFFEVLGKRIDGFHEIETLMVPINLYDSLTFTPHFSPQCQSGAPVRSGGLGAPPLARQRDCRWWMTSRSIVAGPVRPMRQLAWALCRRRPKTWPPERLFDCAAAPVSPPAPRSAW